MRVEISLFRFDYKSDYLPYYTKHFLKIDNEITLLDLLNTLNKNEKFDFLKNENESFCVNKKYLKASCKLSEIIDFFGNDLIIEPLNIRRVNKDFLLNEDDFLNSFNIFNPFLKKHTLPTYKLKEIKELYLSFKIYFYSSNSINIEKNYIGDAVILLASYLINNYKEFEEEILFCLKQQEFSISYHTSLTSRVFPLNNSIENTIQKLIKKVEKDERKKELKDLNKISFSNTNKIDKLKHDFKEFNIAYFYENKKCEDVVTLLDTLKAKIIDEESMSYDLNLKYFNINKEFTFKIAAKVLLDAFDNGADFLLVHKIEHFTIFNSYIKDLENSCNREIPLPIIYIDELFDMVNSNFTQAKKSLDLHNKKVYFLD